MDRPRDPLPTRVRDVPPVPDPYPEIVAAGLAALGITLPPGARDAIDGHAALLLAWTGAINLTGIRDPEGVARLHVLDSLAAAPLLEAAGVRAFVDLGSGGGYPGIPLAAALGAQDALLVDSVGKKARFLATALAATGLAPRIRVAPIRAEALARDPAHRAAWPAVVARAVARVAELAELALPLLVHGGILVAWKREPVGDELAELAALPRDLGAGRPEVVPVAVPGLEGHRLVVVPKIGRTADRYPRDPRERRDPDTTGGRTGSP